LFISLPKSSISSKPSCNVPTGSRFDIDSRELVPSLESILATEKEPIDIHPVGDEFIALDALALAVLPII
jgi:hypothetical protein